MHKWLRSTESIIFEISDGIATITLNRPQKRNALTRPMLAELRQALMEADDRKAVRCVVLQGAGSDFCSGYDMLQNYEMREGARQADDSDHDPALYRAPIGTIDDDVWRIERNQADILTMCDIHKPVIAKIHGHCVNGGTDLALMADIIIAADDARIGFPAVRAQGSPPCHMWTYLVGPQWAKRLLLTGDLILGREAARIGLVLAAVAPAQLDEEVARLASRMALIDADILACNKRTVNIAMELMGGRMLQRLAAETDVRGHLAQSNREFLRRFADEGLGAAFRARDEPFGKSIIGE
ncbi:crotonase/enoyl-CoA hydratase family protein [Vineibacter terrae]|uniref:crotonase/enoyl-CoA hydratase family protein n=1 Tax=Vineibacter terrae TaxID=2586908 RepID=UPI002E36A584|nr:crotonase/enoyl-CoA hydratase family protein [Vineibacter terrae]HEX2886404.1 crotonase/enoyl-CoA hydratase family protein [Vineibacter terrae]